VSVMKLRDYIYRDISVFLNTDEFADMHDIDGQMIEAIIDSDILKIYSNDKTEIYDGVYRGEVALYVKALDLGYRPVYGQIINVDGNVYTVKECADDMGMLLITLEAAES